MITKFSPSAIGFRFLPVFLCFLLISGSISLCLAAVSMGSSYDEYLAAIQSATSDEEVYQITGQMGNDPAFHDGTRYTNDDGPKLLSKGHERMGDLAKASGDMDKAQDEYEQAKLAYDWGDGKLDQAIQEVKDQKAGATTPTPTSTVTPTPTPTPTVAPTTPVGLPQEGRYPPSFTRPDGGVVTINEILKKGMGTVAAGDAPFGKDSDGKPFWPIPPASVTGTKEGGTAGAGTVQQDTPLERQEKLLSLPTKNQADPARTVSEFRPGSGVSVPVSRPTRGPALSSRGLMGMQKEFLRDCVQHARHLSEGNPEKALEIACQWQSLAKIYPDRIEEITLNAARENGFGNFAAWFDSVIQADWQKAYGTSAPVLLSK